MSGFQTTINYQPAVGIEGDWASANPFGSFIAPAGGLTAGPLGVTAGRFAWADMAGVVRNIGSYAAAANGATFLGGSTAYAATNGIGQVGFVHRDQLSLITTWMAQQTMTVVPGSEMTMLDAGDVWCKFAAGATPGQKVYAYYADGTAYAAATASAPSGTVATSTLATATASLTASIAPAQPFNGAFPYGIMTVTVVGSGVVYPGAKLSGGATVSGTQVLEQLSGTAGGVGTYLVSIAQTVASRTITATYGLLTLGATPSGVTPALGQVVTGTDSTNTIATGTQITAFIAGGVGSGATFACSGVAAPSDMSSATVTLASAVETSWYVKTYAAAGELAKISVRHGS